MTEEQANHNIRAYLREREVAERAGDLARVALVDEQLRLLGHEAVRPVDVAAQRTETPEDETPEEKKPVERATSRPKTKSTRR